MTELLRSDLEAARKSRAGQRALETALARLDTPARLVTALGCFIQFNSVFGGCVANLAGEIAVRQDLFRDAAEPVEVLADRSVEIAAAVFFAAIDEFDDRVAPQRDSHRSLAQATLKGAAGHLGFDSSQLNALTQPGAALSVSLDAVRGGYGVGRALEEEDLFRCLGFHLGSELLADEEFNAWDRFLRANYPELVRHLEQSTVRIDEAEHAPYFWIKVHTSVEVDHFDSAVRGANLALRYFRGEAGPSVAKTWLLEGFERFAVVQTRFMESL